MESDNKQAITLSVSELVPPWKVMDVVLDIRELGKQGNYRFGWIRRQANKVAHLTATLEFRGELPRNWTASPPFSLFATLCNDVSLLPFLNDQKKKEKRDRLNILSPQHKHHQHKITFYFRIVNKLLLLNLLLKH